MAVRYENLQGKTFGRLTAISYAEKSKWVCKCSCGGSTTVAAGDLKRGNTKSCGCLARELKMENQNALKHGMGRTKIYEIWRNMHARCGDPSRKDYKWYGGRGIQVCARWYWVENFYLDMGKRPKGKTIDRIDNDGDYGPDNCRWSTPKEQAANQRPKKKRSNGSPSN